MNFFFKQSDTKVQKIDKRHLTMDDLNVPAKRTKLQQKADLIRSPIKSAVLCKEDVSKQNKKRKKIIFKFF